jgi:hypothetical protein
MKPGSLLLGLWKRISGRVAMIDYRIRQRRAQKRQKSRDPNIYPLW